ncbi:hypothetical protein SCANM63S_06221 [Streptomyces canarius]
MSAGPRTPCTSPSARPPGTTRRSKRSCVSPVATGPWSSPWTTPTPWTGPPYRRSSTCCTAADPGGCSWCAPPRDTSARPARPRTRNCSASRTDAYAWLPCPRRASANCSPHRPAGPCPDTSATPTTGPPPAARSSSTPCSTTAPTSPPRSARPSPAPPTARRCCPCCTAASRATSGWPVRWPRSAPWREPSPWESWPAPHRPAPRKPWTSSTPRACWTVTPSGTRPPPRRCWRTWTPSPAPGCTAGSPTCCTVPARPPSRWRAASVSRTWSRQAGARASCAPPRSRHWPPTTWSAAPATSAWSCATAPTSGSATPCRWPSRARSGAPTLRRPPPIWNRCARPRSPAN